MCLEDVNGTEKPAPDVYLLAAKKLKVQIKDCLVIEDSSRGVTAGKTAGETVWAYRNEDNAHQNLSPADRVFSYFAEIQKFIKPEIGKVSH